MLPPTRGSATPHLSSHTPLQAPCCHLLHSFWGGGCSGPSSLSFLCAQAQPPSQCQLCTLPSPPDFSPLL